MHAARTLVGVLLLFEAVALAGPAEAVIAAKKDLETIPEADRHDIRYLTDYHIPEKKRSSFEKVLRFHLNSLSRNPRLTNPTVAAFDLYRIRLSDYRISPSVYEKLVKAPEPYFHVTVETAVNSTARVLNKTLKTKKSKGPQGEKRREAVKVSPKKIATTKRIAAAPFLPKDEIEYLMEETGSSVPILRADWFWVQTVIQEQRVAGYYDFLEIKNRADYELLIGLDIKKAEARFKDPFAIVKKSGVAQHNRQIVRYGTIDSGSWRTLDVFDTETGRRNALQNLGKDYTHDAEEHFGFLPNGLFAYYLSDANGVAQTTAPDKIGPDKQSTSNDFRIHAYLSCVRCHKEGLRPIDDWARKIFQPPLGLAFIDKKRFEEDGRRYLAEIQRPLLRDKQDFEYHLAMVTGWTPPLLSDAYKEWWEWANDREVTLEQAAVELGVRPDQLRAAVLRHAMPQPVGLGSLPLTLAPYAQDPPGAINREQFDEYFQKLQVIASGGIAL